jgi:hypothetical protein
MTSNLTIGLVGQLAKLSELHCAGSITEAEYAAAKSKILRDTPTTSSAPSSDCALDEGPFYALAAREVSGDRLAPAIWGRTLSETDGDTSRARSLYVKLRVAQLLRLLSEDEMEYLRQIWPDMKDGERFVCPSCRKVSTMKAKETSQNTHYCCGVCDDELFRSALVGESQCVGFRHQTVSSRTGQENGRISAAVSSPELPNAPVTSQVSSPSMDLVRHSESTFHFGILSVLLGWTILVPLIGIGVYINACQIAKQERIQTPIKATIGFAMCFLFGTVQSFSMLRWQGVL